MIRIIKFIIEVLFWLQAFACPVIIASLISFFISSDISITALVIGGIAGIIFAEYIRRRFGLDTFFGRLYGPNEMDEKLLKKKD